MRRQLQRALDRRRYPGTDTHFVYDPRFRFGISLPAQGPSMRSLHPRVDDAGCGEYRAALKTSSLLFRDCLPASRPVRLMRLVPRTLPCGHCNSVSVLGGPIFIFESPAAYRMIKRHTSLPPRMHFTHNPGRMQAQIFGIAAGMYKKLLFLSSFRSAKYLVRIEKNIVRYR